MTASLPSDPSAPLTPDAGDVSLPLAVLDFVGVEHGESAAESIAGATRVAQAVEDAGYRRFWVSEHHNMTSLACSAPEILTAHLLGATSRIRVGAAGIMLPNHAPFKVAETFRTLLAIGPGRVDLGLGRAPGTDPLTAHVLRRGQQVDVGAEFPGQVAELLAFLSDGDGLPDGHPYRQLVAAPVVPDAPDVFVLGSSGYGPRFAAANGMGTAFAHHMSPELAVDALRGYREEFTPGVAERPWSAISVLTFASDDPAARARFEAGWRLTMANLARGVREPLRPEDVEALAASPEFAALPRDDGRMVIGTAAEVVAGLKDLQQRAQADEVVLVTPVIDRDSRIASYRAVADAWR